MEEQTERGGKQVESLMEMYFAYGSNLDVNQVKTRCGGDNVRKVTIGYLPNHRLAFTQYYADWGGGVADVVMSPGDSVWGIIYELSNNALELLDAYEGYPHDYTRSKHTIITPEGRVYGAWVYLVERKDGEFIPPSSRYLDVIKQTAKDAGFPKEYIAYLNTIQTVSS